MHFLASATLHVYITHYKFPVHAKILATQNLYHNNYYIKLFSETVFEVARASSAAPATFTEFNNYVDGGLMAYNPCEDGLTEIQEFYRQRGGKLPISLVVSVGSGIPPVRELGAVDLHHTMGPVDLITGRTKQTIDNLMRLISSAVSW